LVEQNLNLALNVVDQVYVISKGQTVFAGSPADLRAQPEVMHRYLGV
jgi:branched-chain amino acid transport system ATP-binding protein